MKKYLFWLIAIAFLGIAGFWAFKHYHHAPPPKVAEPIVPPAVPPSPYPPGVSKAALISNGPDLNCPGYPEKRIFLENHDWYVEQSAGKGHDFGHVSVGTCFPLGQTIKGTVHFDLYFWMTDNPGTLAEYRVDVRSGSGGNQQAFGQVNPNLKCSGSCTFGVYSLNVDTSKLPYAGTTSFLFHAHVHEPDGNEAIATGEWQAIVANGKTVSNYHRSFSIRGAGWYTNDLYQYANLLTPMMAPMKQVSGTWSFNVSTTTNKLPITHSVVSFDPDPDVYPMALGTVVYDAAGAVNKTFSYDTHQLPNGVHKLFIRSDGNDSTGSISQGGITIPFTVQN